ncbi:hypothetical protein LQE22_004292 [Klebsiella oxytoca]|nr:hypothetical protein [Klebsiella oxytoca]
MSLQHKLEILLAWLEDNIEMGTDIQFADGVDSGALLPVVRGAVELLAMPKARRCPPPFSEYCICEAIPSWKMNRTEAAIWNEAQKYVTRKLKGISA